MKKLDLKISRAAHRDLENIWLYTAQRWSPAQGDRYYALIMDEIEFLRSNHLTGKSAEFIRPGYRVSFVKSHIIFYKVSDDRQLEIIRILHQSVDIESWLE